MTIPRADVMVLAQPLPGGRISAIPLNEASIPLFIAGVASDSTAGHDVGDKRLCSVVSAVSARDRRLSMARLAISHLASSKAIAISNTMAYTLTEEVQAYDAAIDDQRPGNNP